LKRLLKVSWLALLLVSVASAQTLSGSLKNGTTGKPSSGDEVILIKLGQGMEEAARTKSDSKGGFSFKLPDPGPHLIRAIHQGVTYHRMAPPGMTTVEMVVYDVSKKVEGVSFTAAVMRFQAQGNELQGIRLFAVDNNSSPPHTQMGDDHFEFFLPENAHIDQAMAMTAGGQPINSSPVPEKEKNCYGFVFPLRPGETQFQVVFHVPYSGELNIDPKPLYGAQHFVVMVPKTMQFTAAAGADFKSMKDPRQSDAVVQVASNTQVGQPLAFKISGTGSLGEAGDDSQGPPTPADGESPAAAGRDSRPGGGLGPPIDAPDPLEKYRWYILGGMAAVLAAGAVYITNRSKAASIPDFADTEVQLPTAARQSPSNHPGLLLEALKDELFQLEVEHKQGGISEQEYERARAALDQTLERALKRAALK
jgi:hypothetical protein